MVVVALNYKIESNLKINENVFLDKTIKGNFYLSSWLDLNLWHSTFGEYTIKNVIHKICQKKLSFSGQTFLCLEL